MIEATFLRRDCKPVSVLSNRVSGNGISISQNSEAGNRQSAAKFLAELPKFLRETMLQNFG
jgi:hypothetical protein